MEGDFVTYDISVKLKAKGYPQKSFGKYSMVGACYFNDGRFYEDGCIANVEDCCSAPQIYEVLKWLREKHATHIEISLGRNGWYFKIIQYEYYEEEKEYDCKLITVSVINDSYEETAIAGIEYVIDNLM